MLRTMTTLICCVLVATAFMAAGAPAASACSCAERLPAAEAAEQAEWVFIAHQIDKQYEETADGRKARLQMEVTTVFKGDVPDSLEIRTNAGGADCGVDFSHLGAVALTIASFGQGPAFVSSCDGIYRPDEIRWLFEPLPTGIEHGDPGFVVGTEVSPARIAMLDRQARLIEYGLGEGRLVDAVVCPGAKKIVEVVQPDLEGTAGRATDPFIEIRDAATLRVESRLEIDLSQAELQQPIGDEVIDLECHDPAGDFVTYLLPKRRWDSPAPLHVWRKGDLAVINAEGARALAIDPERELAYTIVGGDGMTIEVRDLAGGLIHTMPVPLGHQAWKLAFTPDRTALVLLTTDTPMQSEHWSYAEVNSMLVMDIETAEASALPLPRTGNAYLFAVRSDGYTAVTFHLETQSMMITSLRNGEIEILGEYPVVYDRNPVAVGSNTVLLADTDSWYSHAVLALDLSNGEHVSIVDLMRSSVAVAFPGSVPDAQPLPVVTTTTPPAMTTAEVPVGSTTDAPTATTIAAAPEPTDESSDVWPVAIGAVVVVAVMGLAVLLRRRP